MRYDARTNGYVSVFTAKPVPSGMTVIATPAQPNGRAEASSSILQQLSPGTAAAIKQKEIRFNPEATPFVPKQLDGKDQHQGNEEAAAAAAEEQEDDAPKEMMPASDTSIATTPQQGGKKTPCFMYWSTHCPEGALIPLRQPQPPVYFESVK